MPVWLIPVITWFSHNLARFLGVVAIGALLIGGPLVAYHHIKEKAYNEGYKVGYSRAISEHPQITGDNNVINTAPTEKLPFFVLLKIGKFKLLGI